MLPPAVLQLARRSAGGLLSLPDLASAGYDRRRAAAWARGGLLERVMPGWYRVAGWPVPPEQCLHVPLRYLAGCSTTGPPPLLSGEAALALRGTEGFALPCRPLVLVNQGRRVRLTGAPFTVRHVRLDQQPRERVQGLEVADPARSLADAALSPRTVDRTLRVAVDDLRNRYRLPAADLVARWQAEARHPGARRLLAMSEAFEQDSEGERDAFARLFRCCPPLPDCQVQLTERFRVDFAFLFAALVIEYLGDVHDGQADRDTSRTFALERLGHRVIGVTRSMLRHSGEVVAHIHAVRRDRERLMLEGRLRRPPLPPQPPRLVPLRTLTPSG